MTFEPTNIIVFPRQPTTVKALIDYWYQQGYTIGNTRRNNLQLIRMIPDHPETLELELVQDEG